MARMDPVTRRRKLLTAFVLVAIGLTAINWFCQISVAGAALNVDAPEEEADRLLALTERCAFVAGLPLSALLGTRPASGAAFVVGGLNALLVASVVLALYRLILRHGAKG